MGLAAIVRHTILGFEEMAAITVCALCVGILLFNSPDLLADQSKATTRLLSQRSSSRFFAPFMAFLIGTLFQIFILTSLNLCQPESLGPWSFALYGPQLSLGTLFLLTWACLVAKAERQHGDPVICYAYWPKSAIGRLPALLSYYASSNGLFVLILCCCCFVFFDTLFSLTDFEKMDLVLTLGYFLGSYGLLWILCQRLFIPTRPFIGIKLLIVFWFSHFVFMKVSSTWEPLFWTIGEYKQGILRLVAGYGIMKAPMGIQLNFSLTLLWGVFWGSCLSYYYQWSAPLFLAVYMGQVAGSYGGTALLQISPQGAQIFCFTFLALNAYRAQSPIQMIDCPWRRTTRLPLKPLRWLMGMGMSPWTFSFVYGISGKKAVFFILSNFGLLMILGLMYPIVWEMGVMGQRVLQLIPRRTGQEFLELEQS